MTNNKVICLECSSLGLLKITDIIENTKFQSTFKILSGLLKESWKLLPIEAIV